MRIGPPVLIGRFRSLPQAPEHFIEVRGRRRLEEQALARDRMLEPQLGGMEHDTRRLAIVRQRSAIQRAIVEALAAQGRAGFAQVNADLVRAARFQPALHEREVAQLLDDADVGHGPLAGRRAAAAPAVAAVAHQQGFVPLRLRLAANQRQVAAVDRVPAKLLAEVPLGRRRPREHQQAAGFLVEAVHRDHPRRPPAARQQVGKQVRQRLGQEALLAAAELRRFLGMAHRRQAGGLVDHDHLVVDVAYRWRRIVGADLFAFFHPMIKPRLPGRQPAQACVISNAWRFSGHRRGGVSCAAPRRSGPPGAAKPPSVVR